MHPQSQPIEQREFVFGRFRDQTGRFAAVRRETLDAYDPSNHFPPLSNQFKLKHLCRPRRARCIMVQTLVGEISNSLHSSSELIDSASWSQNTWAVRGGSLDRHDASTFWNSAFSIV